MTAKIPDFYFICGPFLVFLEACQNRKNFLEIKQQLLYRITCIN